MIHHILVLGAPRTKKTHNALVRAGKRMVLLPSPQWRRWVRTAVLRCGDAVFLGLTPVTRADVKLHCRAVFYRDADRGDAVGYYQGLADLLEKRGVIVNDRQIVDWSGSQLLKDSNNPRVEVTLEEIAHG